MDVKTIKRIVLRLFPELTGEWHLPHLAKVIAVPELPKGGETSDPFYPHYAVDVVLLDASMVERNDVGILQAVPLPVFGAGNMAGTFAPPALGSIVEIAFHRGNPSCPFVRTVLGLGFTLPAIKEKEWRVQTREGVHHHIDEQGNMTSITDKISRLQCETNEMKANKTWVGNESENVLRLLSDLMQTVNELATTCASHTHTSTQAGTPTSGAIESADFKQHGSSASGLKGRLDPITS